MGRIVLFYPRAWSTPIAVAVVAAFVFTLGIGVRAKRLMLADVLIGVWVWLVAALASIFGVGIFWVVLRDIMDGIGIRWATLDVPIMTACSVVAAMLTLAIERRAARRWSLEGLSFGALTWWLVLVAASGLWMPNSSYLFAWPLLFALIGLSGALLTRSGSALGRLFIFLGEIPTLVLFPPLIRNTFDGLGVRMAGPLMILVTLFLSALLPLLAPLIARSGRASAGAGQ